MPEGSPQFVHLHLHSEYSLLDGANRIDKLIARVKELGMSAVAVTDHGNLHGAVSFYSRAKAAGIKPILGIEAYVAPDLNGTPSDRTSREYTGVSDGGFHLVLLAENNTGWANMLKLSSDAFLKGFYFKPRMDKSTLAQWSDGLIAINGHLGSSIAYHLTQYVRTQDKAHWKNALDEARWHAMNFSPNEKGEPRFFIELQRHVPEQEAINPHLIRLARALDLPLVCDNDSHFLMRDDWDAHDSLCCISMGKIKDDDNRLKYPTDLYVKSPQEMWDLFAEYGEEGAGREALENTVRIADRCEVELDFEANHAPVVKIEYHGVVPGKGSSQLPVEADEALRWIDAFTAESEHPVGSGEWFTAFCQQFEVKPFDSSDESVTAEELKQQCDGALRMLSEAGAIWRYGREGVDEARRARMERELQVLADKLISAYFIIVWDFVNYGRANDIPCNARGSGVGTMVGYCLGLSNACPVDYGLLFERFTDPDRTEYPDIDIDMCQDGRSDLIRWVREKYGHVAQIITFGTLKAKAAIRDVGRVMNIPLSEVDRIAKLIPDALGIKLRDAIDLEPDLKKEYEGNPTYRKLLDTAIKLEGMARHASVHAAGVVVATQPLDNIVPLYKHPSADDVITQWDGPTCEKLGLLKMDFLGLRTLSIIERAKKLIRDTLDLQTQRETILGKYGLGPVPDTAREYTGQSTPYLNNPKFSLNDQYQFDPLELDRLSYRDQNVLDIFRRGETSSVFQFESGGMRDLLMSMRPDRLEDLIAANALYRPGPMDLIPDFNDRKHGRAPVPKVHEIVDRFTAETYGIMVYQEQVMQIVHELGGIPLRAAYSLIKAISKKKESTINANRPKFIEGAMAKGLSENKAEELFDLILKFAGYGFNKSHSTGYAIVAYQTAFLKTYFPVHYMAAVLTYESGSTEKVVSYIDECRKIRRPDGTTGIDVKPPDINRSFDAFTVVYEADEQHDSNHGHIRFGLGAVKGVGHKAVEAVAEARKKDGPFKSLFDFCERVPQSAVNKSCLEALVKCGAFDSLHGTEQRAAMLAAVESAMSRGAQEANLRSSDDFLFGAVADAAPATVAADQPELPMVPGWDTTRTLQEEKSVLGFFVSSNPMDEHRDALQRFSNVSIADAKRLKADTEITVGGILTRVRVTFVKNGRSAGQKMAMITIEDQTASIEGVIFSDGYAKFAHLLQQDKIVFIKGQVDRRREEPSIRINEVIPVNEAMYLAEGLRIILRDREQSEPRQYNGELGALRTMLRQRNGSVPVSFEIHESGKVVVLRCPDLRVRPEPDLPECIDGVLKSRQSCRFLGPTKLLTSNGNGSGHGSSDQLRGSSRPVFDPAQALGAPPDDLDDHNESHHLIAGEADRVVNRLDRTTMSEQGSCPSIDRY